MTSMLVAKIHPAPNYKQLRHFFKVSALEPLARHAGCQSAWGISAARVGCYRVAHKFSIHSSCQQTEDHWRYASNKLLFECVNVMSCNNITAPVARIGSTFSSFLTVVYYQTASNCWCLPLVWLETAQLPTPWEPPTVMNFCTWN